MTDSKTRKEVTGPRTFKNYSYFQNVFKFRQRKMGNVGLRRKGGVLKGGEMGAL